MKSLFMPLLLVSSHLYAEIDYSACVNASQDEFKVDGYGNSVAPFYINKKGQLEKTDAIGSFKHIDKNNEDELTYKTEGLQLKKDRLEMGIREAVANIKRDDSGEIQEIVYSQNYHKEDVRAMAAKQITTSDYKMERKTFFLPVRTHLRFEIKNGKCVPVEKKNIVQSSATGSSNEVELTQYKTQLCHDLKEFMDRNPEAAGCIKNDLNAKAEKILNKHINAKSDVLHLMPERSRALPVEISASLEYKIQGSDPAVFKAYSILESCKNHGLSSVMGNDVWVESKKATSKSSQAMSK